MNSSIPIRVSPGNKHGWFDALDFWYWDGIKNGGDNAEMRLAFPLYDVAKSFDPPHISVDLRGGTPVAHQILVAINGIRIEVAEWQPAGPTHCWAYLAHVGYSQRRYER